MENREGAQNRTFIIVAIGLAALLIVGLVSIAGLIAYTRFLAPSPTPPVVAEATATPEASVTATLSPTPVATPTATKAPTATRVVEAAASPTPGGETPTPGEASATATPAGEDEIPDTGFGPLEAVVGGIILLLLVLFVRRLRLAGRT
jgi:cytoskeletal protein RodZ